MNSLAKNAVSDIEIAAAHAEQSGGVLMWFALCAGVVHALLAISVAIDEVCEKLPEAWERKM